MKRVLMDVICGVLFCSICLYFSCRIFRMVSFESALRDRAVSGSCENRISQHLKQKDGIMRMSCSYENKVSYLAYQVMRSTLRTGAHPPSGSLVSAYFENNYDNGKLHFPNRDIFDVSFDEKLMIYSAGPDRVYGSNDDIGIPLYSPQLDPFLEIIKKQRYAAYLSYP